MCYNNYEQRRTEYASMIEQATVIEGTKFKDINDIIVIYLTKEDIFNMGSTVYNIQMNVMTDTNKYVSDWNCGLKVMYVNTVGLTNSRINDYLKLLTDRVTIDKKYPETIKIKNELTDKVGDNMSKWMLNMMKEERDEGKAEGKAEGMLEAFLSMVKDGLIDASTAAKKLKMSESEFSKLCV